MRNTTLSSDKILTNEHPIYNIEVLNEYYRQITRDQVSVIDTVSVIDINTYDPERQIKGIDTYHPEINEDARNMFVQGSKTLEEKIKRWIGRKTNHFICDGNHRSVAFKLTKSQIPVQLVENYHDVEKIAKEKGPRAPEIMHKSLTFEEYLFRLYGSLSLRPHIITVKAKVERLVTWGIIRIENETIIYNPNALPF
jgi:hypothetical protein